MLRLFGGVRMDQRSKPKRVPFESRRASPESFAESVRQQLPAPVLRWLGASLSETPGAGPSRSPPPSNLAVLDEALHEEIVRALANDGRQRLSGNFRAAVFGANDGLVSNLALVMGVVNLIYVLITPFI